MAIINKKRLCHEHCRRRPPERATPVPEALIRLERQCIGSSPYPPLAHCYGQEAGSDPKAGLCDERGLWALAVLLNKPEPGAGGRFS